MLNTWPLTLFNVTFSAKSKISLDFTNWIFHSVHDLRKKFIYFWYFFVFEKLFRANAITRTIVMTHGWKTLKTNFTDSKQVGSKGKLRYMVTSSPNFRVWNTHFPMAVYNFLGKLQLLWVICLKAFSYVFSWMRFYLKLISLEKWI